MRNRWIERGGKNSKKEVRRGNERDRQTSACKAIEKSVFLLVVLLPEISLK